jgi:hypothetical protein
MLIRTGETTCLPGWRTSTIAEGLDVVLELRDLVEQLEVAELPRGFGRD